MDSENHDLVFVMQRLCEVVDSSRLLLVGARCRDIHQQLIMGEPAARATRDIDLAFGVESWAEFERLKEAFPAPGHGWQSISVEGLLVDILPFGEIEYPPGEVLSEDGFRLNVSGMKEVFAAAQPIGLDNETTVLLPTVPGLAALKLHAWLDRKERGIYKDANDIALIFTWYEESRDRLWEKYPMAEPDEYLGDESAMAALLAGYEVEKLLGEKETKALLSRFADGREAGRRLFADKLGALSGTSIPFTERQLQVEALIRGMERALEE